MKKTTKTISAKDVNQQWWLFDASNQVLGRFASEVAQVLRGKHRPDYSPNIYMGDAVIIVNADKIRVTGNKSETKKYFRHSGCLLYTSPSPRDAHESRMPSSA